MKLFKALNDKVKANNEPVVQRNGVMIVDDSRFSRNVLRDILVSEGYEVVGEAGDGLEAVEKAKEVKPEFIFLDVEMPKLDGLGALPLILKEDPGINIIMCTALGQKKIIIEATKAGAKDYVIKPYRKENITNVIEMLQTIAYDSDKVIPFNSNANANKNEVQEEKESIVLDPVSNRGKYKTVSEYNKEEQELGSINRNVEPSLNTYSGESLNTYSGESLNTYSGESLNHSISNDDMSRLQTSEETLVAPNTLVGGKEWTSEADLKIDEPIQEKEPQSMEADLAEEVMADIAETVEIPEIDDLEVTLAEEVATVMTEDMEMSSNEAVVEEEIEAVVEEEIEAVVEEEIEAIVEEEVEAVVEEEIEAIVEEEVEAVVEEEIEAVVEEEVEAVVEEEIEAIVEEEIEAVVEEEIEAVVEEEIEAVVEEEIEVIVEEEIEAIVEEEIEAIVEEEVEAIVEEEVVATVEEEIEAVVEEEVVAAVEDEVEAAVEEVEAVVEEKMEAVTEEDVEAVKIEMNSQQIEATPVEVTNTVSTDHMGFVASKKETSGEPGSYDYLWADRFATRNENTNHKRKAFTRYRMPFLEEIDHRNASLSLMGQNNSERVMRYGMMTSYIKKDNLKMDIRHPSPSIVMSLHSHKGRRGVQELLGKNMKKKELSIADMIVNFDIRSMTQNENAIVGLQGAITDMVNNKKQRKFSE